MRKIKLVSSSRNQTRKIAAALAREALKKPPKLKHALVFALTGDLGAGKTTFIQGFMKGAGVKQRITSPTFLLIRSYKLPPRADPPRAEKAKSFSAIYHVDFYRPGKPSEFFNLGLKVVTDNPRNIVLIEWAERVKKLLPPNAIWIKFEHGKKENERKLTFGL